MSWFDDWTTRLGDTLIAPQMPFGSMMGAPDPRQRQAMIGNALLTLGGTLSQAGRQGIGPVEGLGAGFSNLADQGQKRAMGQLQMGLLGGKIQEQQRLNQTREALMKNPPPGMTREMVAALPLEMLGKVYIESMKDSRMREAYGSPGGSTPTAPSGGAPQTVFKTGDPVLDLISGNESGGQMIPNAKGSGAHGIFQFMPDTWAGLVKNYGQSHGLTMEGINDPQQQLTAARLYRGEVNRAFGGTATPGQTYLGWFLGPTGGAKMAQIADQNGNMPIDQALTSIFGPEKAKMIMQQNPSLLSGVRTAGDLIGVMNQKMRYAGQQLPAGAQSPMQPAQYTPPAQQAGQPQGQPSPQNDPELAALQQSKAQAIAAGQWDKIPSINADIAKRQGALADRDFELQKSQQQGAERAKIMRDTEVLKADVKDASEYSSGIQASALKSRTAKANLKQLGALLDGMDTGKFKSTTTDIKRMAKGLGIDLASMGVTDDVGPAEAARALVNQMALQMRDPSQGAGMPGAMSDKDREFLMSMVPGLETTPAGRKLMLQYMMRIHDYNIGLAKVVQDYRLSPEWRTQPQGVVRAAQDFAEKNPIFSQSDIDAATQARSAATAPAGQPPGQPTGGPQQFQLMTPPAGAVDMLKKNPSLAPQFDQKYGPGASKRVLGQ